MNEEQLKAMEYEEFSEETLEAMREIALAVQKVHKRLAREGGIE